MTRLPDDLRSRLAGVEGWLSDEEAAALYDMARRCTGRGVIVEIGSFKGRSTISLGMGSRDGAGLPIYAIDPHRGPSYDDFLANIDQAGIDDLVTQVRQPSQQALEAIGDHPIELLFSDGNHKYDMVLQDFALFVPRVVEGGWVVMHDTTSPFPGSKRVAGHLMYRSREFADVRFVPSTMTIGRKVASNTAAQRLRNHAALAVKSTAELAIPVRKRVPAPVHRAGRRLIGWMQ
ncbi:MAG: class I SAM-dependent methyltransferase [Gaiellales bacterium]